MKDIEEIMASGRVSNVVLSEDGGHGVYTAYNFQGSVIFSIGAGWDHVSISPYKKRFLPSWDDMCRLKDVFFYEEEDVIQIHPKKSEYVNNMGNCLHLWRCNYKEMVLPPSILVGVRPGMKASEIDAEIREAYRMAGEEY